MIKKKILLAINIVLVVIITLSLNSCLNEEEVPNENPAIQEYLQNNNISDAPLMDGLYVTVIEEGTGIEIEQGYEVNVYYEGYLLDGTVFDSNLSGIPLTFKAGLEQLISGWDLSMGSLREGDSAKIVMHSRYAYGSYSVGNIPSYSPLVFDIRILEVTIDEDDKIRRYLEKNNITVEPIEDGLYVVKERDAGNLKIKEGDVAGVFYRGFLMNGTLFDRKVTGTPVEFISGNGDFIDGWEKSMQYLGKGDSATIIMHSRYGYGAEVVGVIPANSPLVFGISIEDVVSNSSSTSKK